MPLPELTIRRVLNGHVVQAGCQTLAFEDSQKLVGEISAWILDPEKAEKKYREMHEKNRMHEPVPAPPPPCDAGEPVRNIAAEPRAMSAVGNAYRQ